MGLLDRLSYQDRDRIPRNWKETTVNPVQISAAKQIEFLGLNLLEKSPHLSDNPTALIPLETNPASPGFHNGSLTIPPQDAVDPPKKRYANPPECLTA